MQNGRKNYCTNCTSCYKTLSLLCSTLTWSLHHLRHHQNQRIKSNAGQYTCETQKVRSNHFLHKFFCILLTVDVKEIDWNDIEEDHWCCLELLLLLLRPGHGEFLVVLLWSLSPFVVLLIGCKLQWGKMTLCTWLENSLWRRRSFQFDNCG